MREIEKELVKIYNIKYKSKMYNDAYLAGFRQCVVDFQKLISKQLNETKKD